MEPVNVAEDKGDKYIKRIYGRDGKYLGEADTYNVLIAGKVFCPATAHAVKKILDAGDRGSKGWEKDIDEAINSLVQAKRLRPSFLDALKEVNND